MPSSTAALDAVETVGLVVMGDGKGSGGMAVGNAILAWVGRVELGLACRSGRGGMDTPCGLIPSWGCTVGALGLPNG